MRLKLSNSLRTRPGDYLKDSRLINAYPDVKGTETLARKRPGCVPSSYNFTTPQAFSSIADLMFPQPYGTLGDISSLLFTISEDNYSFIDLDTPIVEPAWRMDDFGAFDFNQMRGTGFYIASDGATTLFLSYTNTNNKVVSASSTDGSNWTVNSEIAENIEFKAAPMVYKNGALYLFTQYYIHKSVDGGGNWSKLITNPSFPLPPQNAHSSISNDASIFMLKPGYAATYHHSADGVNWTTNAANNLADTIYGLKDMVFHGGKFYSLLYGGFGGPGFVGSDVVLAVSSDFINWNYHKISPSVPYSSSPVFATDGINLLLLTTNGTGGHGAMLYVQIIDEVTFAVGPVMAEEKGIQTYPAGIAKHGGGVVTVVARYYQDGSSEIMFKKIHFGV